MFVRKIRSFQLVDLFVNLILADKHSTKHVLGPIRP